MAYSFQIVVDSADPHNQADWWAETLGWETEPTDEGFIRNMVAQGRARESDTLTHRGTLMWKSGAAIRAVGDAEHRTSPRILFQCVPEPKTVKNRLHLDVRVGDEDKAEVRARLESRGATFLWEASEGPFSWYTMADPEGNEFCIT